MQIHVIEIEIPLTEMQILIFDYRISIFHRSIDICISIRNSYISNTDICISTKGISNEAQFWIFAFKTQVSLFKMRISVSEMRHLNF